MLGSLNVSLIFGVAAQRGVCRCSGTIIFDGRAVSGIRRFEVMFSPVRLMRLE
jgi:hypothetical protein